MLSKLFAQYSTNVSLLHLLSQLLLAMVLGYAISLLFLHTVGRNENQKARIFPLISVGMAMVSILLVSSMSLAIGMVGALSLIRFRARIERVEDLVFLFLAIVMGLAAGTDYPATGVLWMVLISPLLLWNYGKRGSKASAMSLSIRSGIPQKHLHNLSHDFPNLHFLSLTQTQSETEWSFIFKPKNLNEIVALRDELSSIQGLKTCLVKCDERA